MRLAERVTKSLGFCLVVGSICTLEIQGQPTVCTGFHTGARCPSSAIPVGSGFVVVSDDEGNTLRLYPECPTVNTAPIWTLDLNAGNPLGLVQVNNGVFREVDMEASCRIGTGSTIVWMGSHSRNDGGTYRQNRYRVFGTTQNGSGASTTLTYMGRHYDHLAYDIVTWDQAHSSYYNFQNATNLGTSLTGAFNIEGLADRGSGSVYVGLRGPLAPNGYAILIPVLNMVDLVTAGSTATAQIGQPVELDLGGRGIRSIERASSGYVIIAGNPNAGSQETVLYTWSGIVGDRPVERAASFLGVTPALNPEALVVDTSATLNNGDTIRILSDDGNAGLGTVSRSASVTLGVPIPSIGSVVVSGNNFQFTVTGRPGNVYTVSTSTDGAAFAAAGSVTLPTGATPTAANFSDPGSLPTTGRRTRIYRVGSAVASSVNAVGFTRINATADLEAVVNLFTANNGHRVADVVKNPTEDTSIQLYSEDAILESYYSSGAWTDPNLAFRPGLGAFVSGSLVTLAGEVNQTGQSYSTIGTHFYAWRGMFGSKFPVAGGVQTSLACPLIAGDRVYKFISGGWVGYVRTSTGWVLESDNSAVSEPSIGVAESFWIGKPVWSRTYSVW